MNIQIKLLRKPAVIQKTLKPHASLYKDIKEGLFPEPVKLSKQVSAWLEHEIDQVLAARIRGCDDNEIRSLVEKLEEDRKNYGLNKKYKTDRGE